MALYSSSIKLLVYVILALHHLDGKVFRDNLMPPMGIRQWASMTHIELNTNTINFYQRPWTTQNTNETTGHSLHKCTGEACVMTTSDSTASRRTLRPRVAELRSRERAGASELVWKKTNTINFHQRPWTTQNTNETTGHSLHKCTGEACVMTTSDSTASRRTLRPRVAELRSRERAGASELVWKKTNTINFHQRPWTTQNTNETTGHSLHKCTGEACVMTTSDSTASRRTLRPRVAELRSRERAGASELVWKKTNTINFHQRPWTTQNTNETTGHSLHKCTGEACVMEIDSCPMGHCGFDKPTTTQTRNSIDQKYRDVSALHQTTSDSTASRRTLRPRVAELRSRERAGASELVWKKTNTINFHQRPWTTQNTNETTGHSLHKCTGEACVMDIGSCPMGHCGFDKPTTTQTRNSIDQKYRDVSALHQTTSDSTASRRTLRPRVAELRSRERAGASELVWKKTNTINFHQRPWTSQNTNETTGHSLHKCTGEACVMDIGSCPMGHCGFDKPTTTQTRNSIDQKYRDVSALHQTTSDSTASRRTLRPRVAELRSRERAGASELVWKKTNTINFHQRPWTSQNTNETTGHSLHKCTGEACVMEIGSCPMGHCGFDKPTTTQTRNSIDQKYRDVSALHQTTSDSTASLRTLRPRVAELKSRERAGASELVWKKMVEVINGAEERRIEAACCMFLALCCWLYGMGLLLTISVRGLLQIMVALELHGDEQKERGAERETDSCKDAQTAPVLVTTRGSTKKRARRLRRQSNKGKH
ncbi:unnamed protein product [Coregonus sp. 'balchen']|nr:unnamed protein product [Coregonus sp. 'balchen']